jgi:two-component system sensor histidine kinase KdpD
LIEQVCTNLLHNASLYTPPGTVIAIDASIYENELLLTIHDNGPGFPADAQKRIFDKFYRVPGTRTGGTGLGLSIVRGFVEAHKGTITASNKPSGGAQFVIRIPVEVQQPMEIQ